MKTKFRIAILAAAALLASFVATAQVNSVPGPGTRDVSGAAYANSEGTKASYFASLGANTPAATPTDVSILTGSATKTIKVTKVRITMQATASGAVEWRLIKRSGGTQSAVDTAFANGTHSGPMDSSDPASTVIAAGLAGVYTGNPASTGTVVGIVDDWTVTQLANATMVLEYSCIRPARCITLRGTAQKLAINGNGHTLLTGEKVGISYEWTEE